MSEIPEHERRKAERALAAILDRRMPPDAHVIQADDLTALAWAEDTRQSYAFFRKRKEGTFLVPTGRLAPDSPDIPALLRTDHVTPDGDPDPFMFEMGSVRRLLWSDDPDGPGSPEPARQAALLALAGGMDAPALMLLHEIGARDREMQEFLDSSAPDADLVHELVRTHPWVALMAMDRERGASILRRGLPRHGMDGAAARVLLGEDVDQSHAEKLVRRLRWMLPARSHLGVGADYLHCLLARVPEACFPPLLAEGDRLGGQAQRDMDAFRCAAHLPVALAEASGRPFASVTGRVAAWRPYLDALGRKAGLHQDGTVMSAVPTERLARDVSGMLLDMVQSFTIEVMAPAYLACGGTWETSLAAGHAYPVMEEARAMDPLVAASMRLLLGEGTLPALMETCARWHARSHGIALFTSSLAAGVVHDGPGLFEDVDLGGGVRMTCLNTVGALLDEGAPDPDPWGVPGMDHCVGSYGLSVASGTTAVVSLRRDLPGGGYERLSTAEVDFSHRETMDSEYRGYQVVQHFGRGNSAPDAGLEVRLEKGLKTVARGARQRLEAFSAEHPDPVLLQDLVVRTGAWDSLRDMWSFALTRPQRTLDAEGLLDAAGVEVPSRSPHP